MYNKYSRLTEIHRRQPHDPYKIPDGGELDDDLHGLRMRNISTQRTPRGPVLRPSWTVRERLNRGETAAHKLGARSLTEQPASQLSSQNKALEASLTSTETEASKKAYAERSVRKWNNAQVLSGSVRASQSHRRRRAIPKVRRLGRPRPPKRVGQVTFTHAT
jgi:hypothetical protein